MQTLLASELSGSTHLNGIVTLVFTEDRVSWVRPITAERVVVARVAVPINALGPAIENLTNLRDAIFAQALKTDGNA